MTEKKFTIKKVKQLLNETPVDKQLLTQLQDDKRAGVQQALRTYYHRQEREQARREAFQQRLVIERSYWEKGVQYVAGIDEVGRGPLAGPVVAAAVILPHDFALYDVNDSKQLSATKREVLYQQILTEAVAVAVGWADNRLIDEVNIYQATITAMEQAVADLTVRPDQLLIDAMTIASDVPQQKLIKGDAKSASIAAASIVAKVNRDHLMAFYDEIYPGYEFGHNAGYGTKAHLQGLANYGVSPIHRRTFEPIKTGLVTGKYSG